MVTRNYSWSLAGTVDPVVFADPGTVVLGRIPSAEFGGGETVIQVHASAGGGTGTFHILDRGAAGTSTAGTIVSLSAATFGNKFAGSVLATPYFLDAGDYIGIIFTAGTATMPVNLDVTTIVGRADK
jgi:hypothetical protein